MEWRLNAPRFFGAEKVLSSANRWMSLRPVSPLIGCAPPSNQFHAVVVHGIVAGSDFNPAVHIEMEGGEIHLLGADKTNIDDIDTGIHQPLRNRLFQQRAGQADIATDNHPARFKKFSESPADAAGNVLVEFSPEFSSDIIGFKTRQCH